MSKKENKSGSVKKRINYSVGYILLIVAVVVVFVVVNIILEQLPMSLDFTANEQFSITKETEELLDNLTEDVEIIALYDRVKVEADTQKAEIIRILDIYDRYDHVDVSYVSLDVNPNIVNDSVGAATAGVYSEGDYIVKSAKRNKRIAANDMFETEVGYVANILPMTYTIGNKTEQSVSTAIKYVTLDIIPNLYISTGLQENSKDDYGKILEDIDNMNISMKDIDLSKHTKMPEDAGALVFLSPKRDLSQTEYDMLRQWMEFDGGMIFIAFDSDMTGTEMTRFNLLLSELYGMEINNDIVSDEEDYQLTAANKSSVITATDLPNGPLSVNPLSKTFISYDSRSIDLLNMTGYFETHPIIQTSKTGKSTEYVTGEETTGVTTLVACSEYFPNTKHSRIVVMGSSLGLTDDYISKYSDTSSEWLFLYSIDWLIGEGTMEALDIEAKAYNTTMIKVEKSQSNLIFTFSVVIYPLVIIGIGVFVWVRRRHL